MSHDSDKTAGTSGVDETEDEPGDDIDAKLKLLGDAFLDDDTPAALLDVLRRAASARRAAPDNDAGDNEPAPTAGEGGEDRELED
ncbi:MAG: hypothetical protein R3F54_16800 [Alphaproteobacteria bacterium]